MAYQGQVEVDEEHDTNALSDYRVPLSSFIHGKECSSLYLWVKAGVFLNAYLQGIWNHSECKPLAKLAIPGIATIL